MPASGPRPASHLVPLMRYRDVGIASEWLCATFGFDPHFAAKAPDGSVFYAELRAGTSMIMLGAAGEPNLDAVMRAPADSSEIDAQACYVVVADVEGHYAHASQAGVDIVLELKHDDRGGAGYSCRDPEGHVWNFGTYDPWTAQSTTARRPRQKGGRATSRWMGLALVLTLAGSAVSGWYAYDYVRGGAGLTAQRLREALLGVRERGLSTGTITDRQRDERETSRALEAMAALKAELEKERREKTRAVDAAASARAETRRIAQDARTAAASRREASGTQAARAEAQASQAAQSASHAQVTAASLRTEIDALQVRLEEAQESKAAAEKALAQAEAAAVEARSGSADAERARVQAEAVIAQERADKTSAQKALADAGARIAELEKELASARASASANSLKRMRAVSTARATKPKPKPNPNAQNPFWPYSW
jgi:uncharacterized glyoxalase superfamily protein PhnB